MSEQREEHPAKIMFGAAILGGFIAAAVGLDVVGQWCFAAFFVAYLALLHRR